MSRRARNTYGSLGIAGAMVAAAVTLFVNHDDGGDVGLGATEAGTADPARVASAAEARTQLDGLTVAPEDTGYHYDRDDWPHWSSVGEGCNTREAILINEGRGVERGKDCTITNGEWTSVYDGVTVTDPGTFDIDHIVPLAEVARSGARGWTRAEREMYANDFEVLVAVSAKSNRAKGDQDPATWLPELDRCGYVARWVTVKAKYELTLDPDEHAAITAVLGKCGR